MKARKTLELRFPDSFTLTLFLWDNGHKVWDYEQEATAQVLRVKVQRRTERAEIRRISRPYGATATTIVE